MRTLEALAGTQPYLGSSYYKLGRLYDKKNRTADAVSAYEKFLNLWKNADRGLPQVADAQKRLTSLRAPR